ncbi:MAG TPA: DUF4271 domain-containing protein [Bacteroidales bacterium]|nr:DUF4271 domain-containing protein [Bacteroidales bacterium]
MYKTFQVICNNTISLPVIERQSDNNQIVICVSALIIIILLLIVKLLFDGYFKIVISSVFRNEVTTRNIDESNYALNQASLITGIITIISITTALFSCVAYFTKFNFIQGHNSWLVFLSILSIVICYTFYYKISLSLLGWILDLQQLTSKYSKVTSDIFRLIGLVIFPFFLVISFSEVWMQNYLVYSMLIIIVLAFTIRLYNFLLTIFKIKFLNHYTILYFCVFEILPILFIVKIAGSLSDV